jgi:integrase
VSLAQARAAAAAARALLAQGIDPIDARRREQVAAQAQASIPTFAEAAARYVAAHEATWRHPKHRLQWRNSLALYALPVLGPLSVSEIDITLILRVLQPIWKRIPETASRVRARIETILDYAAACGWRSASNPAIWRGNLKLILASPAKLRPVEHYAALPWREAPAFMTALRQHRGSSGAALAFIILTAARSNEARGARWDEIDVQHAMWTIPASRMKGRHRHRVPLSAPALEILQEMKALRDDGGLVFPGLKRSTPMSDVTLGNALRRMGRDDLTVHGFRSTFRDWVADTGKSADAAEAALAHARGNSTRTAYERTDLFDPRRRLMDEWAEFLGRAPAEVVPLHPQPSTEYVR